MFQQEPGGNRCDNLCRHAEGIIQACEFSDVAVVAHVDDDRKNIHAHRRTAHTYEDKPEGDKQAVLLHEGQNDKGNQHHEKSHGDDFFAANPA